MVNPKQGPASATAEAHRPSAAGARLRDGRRRVAIEGLEPTVDAGRFPVKRVVGEPLEVEVDLVCDGHDVLAGVLRVRAEDGADPSAWQEVALRPRVNDRWSAQFVPRHVGRYRYAVQAWVDRFAGWRRDLLRRAQAKQELGVELLVGAVLLERCAERAEHLDAELLRRWAAALADGLDAAARLRLALDERVAETVSRYPERRFATASPELPLVVDRERARFSAWYELFPRSAGPPGRHGTLRDVAARLDDIAWLGFDVLYLPPIHPIGETARKGPNNAVQARPGDPGSPWAIGSAAGGHDAVHPELGTVEDVRRLAEEAARRGIDLALDLAFQCAPDHPWVREHPEWFRHRPDGSIRSAENPPKRYEDIYPFDFECDEWRALWRALRDVVLFWVRQGVRVFRVDNPHTKPFALWEYLIDDVKQRHPDVLFLSEAFTRPKVMARLAKLGFTQSYTYFTWRNTRQELTEYFTELTRPPLREFFRANLWPNTPDILPEPLQVGGRAAFVARLVLAATLGASYGIYGPAFEVCEATPRAWGGEEYLDSEKYQLRAWDLEAPGNLRQLIARLNRIRRENPALHSDRSLRFHPTDNEALLCYSKRAEDGSNTIVVVVNLDPHHAQEGWVDLPLRELAADLGADLGAPTQAHDLLGDLRVLWSGERQFVSLAPWEAPAQVFRLRRRLRTERDFDYFL